VSKNVKIVVAANLFQT